MGIKNGIFGLQDVYELQMDEEWTKKSEVFLDSDTSKTHSVLGWNYGYWLGGNGLNTFRRTDFTNDTDAPLNRISIPITTISSSYLRPLSTFGSKTKGYFVGQTSMKSNWADSTASGNMISFSYANDTAFQIPGVTSIIQSSYAASAFTDSYAYTVSASKISKFDFANDNTASIIAYEYPSAQRQNAGVTGNQSYGYIGGGYSPNTSSVTRIDYSSDTSAPAPKGNLTVARSAFGGATGNANYGWWQGASPNNTGWTGSGSTVDRLDYANDTANASPRGNLIYNASMEPSDGACGNSVASYLGGYHPSNKFQKISYDNDTVTATALPASQSQIFTGCFSAVQYGLPIFSTQALGYGPQLVGHATGYFAGGMLGTQKSTVERIDYSNDTAAASVKGPLNSSVFFLGAVGNSTHGYCAGGRNPTYIASVDRIDYSNDTAAATPKGPLTTTRAMMASSSGSSYFGSFGYFVGGDDGSADVSTVDRIDYVNDTASASPKGPLNAARKYLAGTGNQTFGYFAGGSPGSLATVERISYAQDSAAATPKGSLTDARFSLAATGNSTHGYFGGGGSPDKSTVERISYANDTVQASPKGPLSSPKLRLAATGNDSFGYFGGGEPGPKAVIDRIDYSNDTVQASPKGNLTVQRDRLAALSSHANALPNTGIPSPGKFSLGTNLPELSNSGYYRAPGGQMMRLDYVNDNFAKINAGTYTPSMGEHGQTASSRTSAYWAGNNASGDEGAFIDKLDYASEDLITLRRAPLPTSMRDGGYSFNLSYGWFSGGYNPSTGRSSVVYRLDYSNDSTAPVTKGPLTATRYRLAAAGNQNYGYHAGGEASGGPHPTVTTVERIDYSNDAVAATPKGPLVGARRYFGASGNADFGYFGGGDHLGTPISTVDRIDFSNDTATASPKGPLDRTSLSKISAMGSGDGAYFMGGSPSSPDISRIEYSNDTRRTLTTSNLYGYPSIELCKGASARGNGAPFAVQTSENYANTTVFGFPAANFIYFAGGAPSSESKKVSRYNVFNDTAKEMPSVQGTREYGAATGNNNFGYLMGSNTVTYIERIDYNNDEAKPLVRGNLDNNPAKFNGYMGGATGNSNFGYYAPGYKTSVQRIDYSNDTGTPSFKGDMLHARYYSPSQFTGNQSFGYYFGGRTTPGPWVTTTDRLDYSSDTAAATPKGNMRAFIAQAGTASNSAYSYIGGGYAPGNPGAKTTIDRFDFANDTATTVGKGALNSPTGAEYAAATGNGSNGFFTGSPGNGQVYKMDYANDTGNVTTTGPTAGTIRQSPGGISGFSSMECGLDVNTFSTPLVTPPATNYGYFLGDSNRNLQRIDYTNDTATGRAGVAMSPSLVNSNGPVAASSQNHGYWAGGTNNPSPLSGNPSNGSYHGIVRLDYSNDLFGMAFRSQLYAGMYGSPSAGAAVYNTNYGYWAGSWNLSGPLAPSPIDGSSAVNRLDYSNDTADAIIRGNLFIGTSDTAGVGNQSYGYFIGGKGDNSSNPAPNRYANSCVQRVDYSSDNVTWTAKGPLTYQRTGNAATGNASYAWIGGGYPSPSNLTVERLDYSNDTNTPTPKGNLAVPHPYCDATGNASFGYWTRRGYSEVNRIDYSNDTAEASPRGNLGGPTLSNYGARAFSAAANALPQ